ncbi:hypothetical protein DSO57_1008538 [Entomophthora muscae]|uniref:Uncharacterized protein n=1 Tax=Entomophthora muscae TaxID=34485 RepID=A0ACC2UH24_9FUNG|nr:hypothetical protein DSO57_1008538 [Entomophthora muscae]
MEFVRNGKLMSVESIVPKSRCDQCRISHVKCDRRVPACQRCLKLGKYCTRERRTHFGKISQCLSREGWILHQRKVIATWTQVIDMCLLPPISRLRLQGYLLPLEFVLPKPTESREILMLSSCITKASSHSSEASKPLHVVYTEIEDILDMSIKVFFHLFNPFFPLFSEEGFYCRPRSNTLKKLVIQIGLERMPQTDLVRTAIFTNNLTLQDLTHLPNTLDSLQCLLLAQFGAQLSWVDKIRYRTFLIINRLAALLGLHQTLVTSQQWLERTLALHLISVGAYSLSVGQSIVWDSPIWLKVSGVHMNPNFLSSVANHFPTINDKIHFITSQAIYHSFTIVLDANRDCTLASKKKINAARFTKCLNIYFKQLPENLMWGWHNLSKLANIPCLQAALLRQSRLALALRYNNDFIELSKLSSYIPSNPLTRVSPTPLTPMINAFSQKGLSTAIHTIRLALTLTPSPFGMDFIQIIIPSIAYIIAYIKPFKEAVGHDSQLVKALAQARMIITRGTNPSHPNVKAKPYLDLIDYLLERHHISFLHPNHNIPNPRPNPKIPNVLD